MRRFGIARDDSGVSLLELVIASAILFIAAIGTVTALAFAASATQQSTTRTRALNLANQRLEQARAIPYDNVGVVYEDGSTGDPQGTIPAVETVGNLVITTAVDYLYGVDDRPTYKRIKITVAWQDPRPGSLSIASSVFGKSSLTNFGDLRVVVREMGTDVPIEMAQVYVTPAGSLTQRIRWTGVDGKALFGRVPIGNAQVQVTASGWVFDTITPPMIQADTLTTLYVYGYQPCTAVVTVIDQAGLPVSGATIRLMDSKSRYFYGTTGGDGVATISGLLPDTYSARASLYPYTSATAIMGPMASGGTYTRTLVLTPPGSLRVRVKDSSGAVLPGATVRVTGPFPDSSSEVTGSPVNTGSAGEASFASLTGTYTVATSLSGYSPSTVTGVVVVSGVERILDVTLSPAASTGSLRISIKKENGTANTNTGVRIQWWPDGASSGTYTAIYNSSTGINDIANLTPGTYRARVRIDSEHWSDSKFAIVVSGQQQVIELRSDYNPH
jgi:hypothetical protein